MKTKVKVLVVFVLMLVLLLSGCAGTQQETTLAAEDGASYEPTSTPPEEGDGAAVVAVKQLEQVEQADIFSQIRGCEVSSVYVKVGQGTCDPSGQNTDNLSNISCDDGQRYNRWISYSFVEESEGRFTLWYATDPIIAVLDLPDTDADIFSVIPDPKTLGDGSDKPVMLFNNKSGTFAQIDGNMLVSVTDFCEYPTTEPEWAIANELTSLVAVNIEVKGSARNYEFYAGNKLTPEEMYAVAFDAEAKGLPVGKELFNIDLQHRLDLNASGELMFTTDLGGSLLPVNIVIPPETEIVVKAQNASGSTLHRFIASERSGELLVYSLPWDTHKPVLDLDMSESGRVLSVTISRQDTIRQNRSSVITDTQSYRDQVMVACSDEALLMVETYVSSENSTYVYEYRLTYADDDGEFSPKCIGLLDRLRNPTLSTTYQRVTAEPK